MLLRIGLKKTFMYLLILFMLLSLVQIFAANENKANAAGSYEVVGYYPAWGIYGRSFFITDIDPNKETVINYAFADICWNGIHGNPDPTGPNPQTWACADEVGNINVPNGTIVQGDPWADSQYSYPGDVWSDPIKGNFKQLNVLKQQNPNLKTVISVGGWSWSNRFSDVAASATTRQNFANSAVDFLRKYGFDGVDLDWEYPVEGGLPANSYRAADKANYTLLLQAVRSALDTAGAADGKHYLLTIASGASQNYINNTELNSIAQIVDWINIMTYDFNGGWQTVSGHNAPLYYDSAAGAAGLPNASTFNVDSAVQSYFNAGVPANKLVLGLPFYGRGWAGCASTNNGEYQSCTGTVNTGTWDKGVYDFNDLEANYINKNGYTRHWNDTAKVPFLYNSSNQAFITYDDAESIGYKTSYIKSNNLKGAMFWEVSSDRNHTLLNKVNSDLSGGSNPTPTPTATPTPTPTPTSTNTPTPTPTVTPTPTPTPTSTPNGCTDPAWNASTAYSGGARVSYNGKVYQANWWTQGDQPDLHSGQYDVWSYVADCDGDGGDGGDGGSDTQAPTAPTNLVSTGKTSGSVSLSWGASTDNVGVTGYNVYNGSSLATTVSGTSATVSGLSADTAYTFTVKAKDAANNLSTASNSVNVTTNSSTGSAQPWATGVAYHAGDLVSYGGSTYKCLQPHTSLAGWEPPNVPALWQLQ